MLDRFRPLSLCQRLSRRLLGALTVSLAAGATAEAAAQAHAIGTEPLAVVAGRNSAPARKAAGVVGTDLGWSFEHEGRLWVLFGDSWQADEDGKRDLGVKGLAFGIIPYDAADDALGFVSLSDSEAGFPDGPSVEAYIRAHPAPADQPSWHAESPRLDFARLNPADAMSLAGPTRVVSGGNELESGPALTPFTGFSNAQSGERSGAFGIFMQNVKLACRAGECDGGYTCEPKLGLCLERVNGILMTDPSATSQPCVIGSTARPTYCEECKPMDPQTEGGLCVDTESSVYDESLRGKTVSVAHVHQVGNARREDPLKFDSQPWLNHRFYNLTARTVSDFDATRANGVGNDYRKANGDDPEREGVFIWGRPNFAGVAAQERDAQLYLAWVDMPSYDRSGNFAWAPQYFAGLDQNGAPIFEPEEKRAQPLDLDAATAGHQPTETIDIVGQMSLSWLPSLQRWVMFYGGGLGVAFGEMLISEDLTEINRATVGPIYVRYAEHPWGPWTAPTALFKPGDPQAATEQYRPGGILFSPSCNGAPGCAEFEKAWPMEHGLFYGPDIIEPWTTEHSDGTADVYWHLSTWNPYQVVLMKTKLAPR